MKNQVTFFFVSDTEANEDMRCNRLFRLLFHRSMFKINH